MKKSLALVLTLSLACLSCVADETPELPPAGSLSLDLQSIIAAPAAAKNAPTDGSAAAPEDYVNFANAWARVKVVQLFAGLVIALPAAAIAAALSQEAVQRGNKFFWTVTALGTTADLEVVASPISGFDLELYVTNEDLDRYLWVEGNFGDGTGTGEWVLHDPNIDGADDRALSIQWTYVSDSDRALTYEILSPTPNGDGQVFQGDTFTYAVDGDTASLEYIDADQAGSRAVISWSLTTGAGSITVPGFNAGAQACWDDLFENAACP